MCVVCDWLLSLGMFSRFNHVVACVRSVFLFYCQVIFYFMDISLFCPSVHPLMDIWVVPNFCLLWIMMLWYSCTNFWVDTCFHFSWVYIPRSRNAASHGISILNLLRNCQTILQSGCTILYSHQQCMRVPLSPHSCQPDIIWLFDAVHPGECEVVSHCGFVISSVANVVEHLFMCSLAIYIPSSSLEKFYSDPLPTWKFGLSFHSHLHLCNILWNVSCDYFHGRSLDSITSFLALMRMAETLDKHSHTHKTYKEV